VTFLQQTGDKPVVVVKLSEIVAIGTIHLVMIKAADVTPSYVKRSVPSR
jgi:hypothetical protein